MTSRFHEYLIRYRKLRGYTQAQMAQKLEISRPTYTNYETGYRSPDLQTLEKISDELGCSMDQLFGRQSAVHEPVSPYGPEKNHDKKRLAIGVQDYRSMIENGGYFVDKSHMIEEFWDSPYQVALVTRPRRFGKSLNMSMLAEFLDCTKSSDKLFSQSAIYQSSMMEEMNQHPVIFLSFLNTKGDTASSIIYQIMVAILREYERQMESFSKTKKGKEAREKLADTYACLKRKKADEETKNCLSDSIALLSQVLMEYYGKKVFLLIDEYDTPFIAAYVGGYYAQVKGLLAALLSNSLKGNPAMEKALITGIQRVAKENIFSGLNNLIVCTVYDQEYQDCFGFTEEETRELLGYYGLELTKEVKAMYDGYRFGDIEVYNPWSITNYAVRKRLEPYWVHTSENSMIQEAMVTSSSSFEEEYQELMQDGSVEVLIEMDTSYFERKNDEALWGLLVHAGMVTIEERVSDSWYIVRIPNYEIRKAFQDLTASYLQMDSGQLTKLMYYLQKENMKKFLEEYKKILLQLPSYHDLKDENSYHMMFLGMCAFLYQDYDITSNREQGKGRSDILLRAKSKDRPNMIFEFKYTKDSKKDLKVLAKEAVDQIHKNKYDIGLSGKTWYIGLAHRGKEVEATWEVV